MRSPEDVFEEIEKDRAVREQEIRLVENSARKTLIQRERDMYLRVSVLLTYAHLEGFCKFALTAYVSAVNSTRLPCRVLSDAVVAATLTTLFRALRNPESKHPLFAKPLPDDAKLHLVFRERAFVAGLEGIADTRVAIPDTAVDSESNLSSVVLRKNLYKVGLEHQEIDKWKGDMDKLLGIRNHIAHGAALKAPDQIEVEKYVATTLQIMGFVQTEIFSALKLGAYRKFPAGHPAAAED